MKNVIQKYPAAQDAGQVKEQVTKTFMEQFFDGGEDEQNTVFQQNGIWTGILLFMENSDDDDLIGKVIATSLFDCVRNFDKDIVFWFYSLGLMAAWHETLSFEVIESRVSNGMRQFLSDNDLSNLQSLMEVARRTYIIKKGELADERKSAF